MPTVRTPPTSPEDALAQGFRRVRTRKKTVSKSMLAMSTAVQEVNCANETTAVQCGWTFSRGRWYVGFCENGECAHYHLSDTPPPG